MEWLARWLRYVATGLTWGIITKCLFKLDGPRDTLLTGMTSSGIIATVQRRKLQRSIASRFPTKNMQGRRTVDCSLLMHAWDYYPFQINQRPSSA